MQPLRISLPHILRRFSSPPLVELAKYLGHYLLPFVLCRKDLSKGALLDEHVREDGEPCGGRRENHPGARPAGQLMQPPEQLMQPLGQVGLQQAQCQNW